MFLLPSRVPPPIACCASLVVSRPLIRPPCPHLPMAISRFLSVLYPMHKIQFFAAFTADGTPLPEPQPQLQRASSIPWNRRAASQFRQTDPTSFHAVSPPSQRHPNTMGHRSGVESAFGASRGGQGLDLGDRRNSYKNEYLRFFWS